jgi:hypothetical protein
MSPILPVNLHCPECEDILRELLNAREADLEEMRQHLLDAARSSGREAEELRNAWLSSVMKMPDNEMLTVLRAHTPRTTEQAPPKEVRPRNRDRPFCRTTVFDGPLGIPRTTTPEVEVAFDAISRPGRRPDQVFQ